MTFDSFLDTRSLEDDVLDAIIDYARLPGAQRAPLFGHLTLTRRDEGNAATRFAFRPGILEELRHLEVDAAASPSHILSMGQVTALVNETAVKLGRFNRTRDAFLASGETVAYVAVIDRVATMSCAGWLRDKIEVTRPNARTIAVYDRAASPIDLVADSGDGATDTIEQTLMPLREDAVLTYHDEALAMTMHALYTDFLQTLVDAPFPEERSVTLTGSDLTRLCVSFSARVTEWLTIRDPLLMNRPVFYDEFLGSWIRKRLPGYANDRARFL